MGAAAVLAQARDIGEKVRDLTYRLYTTCERKGWTHDALAYNGLVVSWTSIVDLSTGMQQTTLL